MLALAITSLVTSLLGTVSLAGTNAFPTNSLELEATIQELPEFHRLWTDQTFRRQFDQYMRWLASPGIGAPDAVYLMDAVDAGVNSIDLQSAIFHEMIEFKNWMSLGHKFNDIMTIEYYRQNYPVVYPTAHCHAIIDQTQLLNTFARRKGLGSVPILAYDLVFPDYERRESLNQLLPIPMLVRQLKFNQSQFDEKLVSGDLEMALQVFERGGYSYQNSALLLSYATAFLQLSRPERMSQLHIQSVSTCKPIRPSKGSSRKILSLFNINNPKK
jgi:hypothetical protein